MVLHKEHVLRIWTGARDRYTKHSRFALWFKLVVILPTVLWLLLFNFYVQIPFDMRPKINVSTLPEWESFILDGNSLQTWPRTIISEDNSILHLLDFLAAFVYLIHFAFAWVFMVFLYLHSRNRKTMDGNPIVEPWTFLLTMGILNLVAVATQVCWPTAPPWYITHYGDLEPSYSMSGDEAELARVDEMLQFDLFKKLYGQSPIVFGSFPSLHAAWPLVITIFAPNVLLIKATGCVYVLTVWWAAMYLNHHFFVDLLGGAVYTLFAYIVAVSSIRALVKHSNHKIYSRGSGVKWSLVKEKEDDDLPCGLVIELPNICQEDTCWTPSKSRRLVNESVIPLLKEL